MVDAWEIACPTCESVTDVCSQDGKVVTSMHVSHQAKKGGSWTKRAVYTVAYHAARIEAAKLASGPGDCCFCGQAWEGHVLEACFWHGDSTLPEDAVRAESGWGWEVKL